MNALETLKNLFRRDEGIEDITYKRPKIKNILEYDLDIGEDDDFDYIPEEEDGYDI